MSTGKTDSTQAAQKQSTDTSDLTKKLDVNMLEEDDEFEEFPVEEWAVKELADDTENDVNVWEDNWDDDEVEDDFSKQLRDELEKKGIKTSSAVGGDATMGKR